MQRWVLVILLLAGPSFAQFRSDASIHRLHIKVIFSSGICDSSTLVTLIGRIGALPDHQVDKDCVAQFVDVPVTRYQVSVSGPNVADTYLESIDPTEAKTEFEVNVRSRWDSARSADRKLRDACVSVTDLSAPRKAQRELQKGYELIIRNKLDKAKDHLLKAIAIYPRYAAAYNDLAAIYASLGDRTMEFSFLQKAISLDDHLSVAYVNLARMQVAASDFPAAERTLRKASSCDNGDVAMLNMLAYAQFMNRHFDDALQTSRRAHDRGGMHATVHWVAERILKARHQVANATTEMKTFLKEEPSGDQADAARKELLALQATAP